MRVFLVSLITGILKDLRQVIPFLAILVAFRVYDVGGYQVSIYMLGLMTLLSMFAHIVRRLLFKGVDLEKLYETASSNPVASALVFAAIAFVYGTLFLATAGMFK